MQFIPYECILRHLPQKIAMPRFLVDWIPPRKPSSRGFFPQQIIKDRLLDRGGLYIYSCYSPRGE